MPKKIKKLLKVKKIPIIIGTILAVFVSVILIGAISTSLSGNSAIKMVSAQSVFQSSENPQFIFVYKKQANIFSRLFTSISSFFTGESKKIEAKATIFDKRGQAVDTFTPEIQYQSNGKISLSLDHAHFQQELRPGKYRLEFEVKDGDKTYTQEQDFTWGVLAINTNKSIYLPGENAYLQFAVLKDDGHTICDANLKLRIKNEKENTETELSTENGAIRYSGKCSGDNVTDVPDYYVYFRVDKPGIYEMKLTNLNNGYEISDKFEVRESVPFEVERIGPTRIYPPAKYEMKIKIKANQDFNGEIVETVPFTFAIDENTESKIIRHEPDINTYTKQIGWEVDLKAGDTYEIKYIFDAPDISPYLYLLGPLRLVDTRSGRSVFQEARSWQIAADSETEIFITYDEAPTGSCGSNCWTVPADWNNASNSVEVIGGGGGGADSTNAGGGGGGGGAYSKVTNLTLSGNITFDIGASGSGGATSNGTDGGDTWFNATSLADCVTKGNTICVGAEGGNGGLYASPYTGGAGGLAANSVGTTTRDGGSGGTGCTGDGSGGGGGAGGTHGDGIGNAGGIGSGDTSPGLGGGGGGGGGGYDGLAGTIGGVLQTCATNTSGTNVGGVGGNNYAGTGGGAGGDLDGGAGSAGGGGGGGDDGGIGGNGGNGTDWETTPYGSGGGGGGGGDGKTGGYGGKYGGGGGGGEACTATTCYGAGGLIHISYTPAATAISGTCKQYDETTNCSTCTDCVRAAVGTTLQTGAASQGDIGADGTWSLNLDSTPAANSIITVFLNNLTANENEAIAIMEYDGAGNITGVQLFEQHITIANGGNTNISNADLGTYDNSVSADEDIFFDVSSGLLNYCVVAGCEKAELFIDSGMTYQPGGSMELHDIEIDGTFTIEANTASISGGWNNDATFTAGTSTIFFTATASAEIVSASAGTTNSFYNLQFGDSATTSYTGQWTLNGNETTFDVNNNLTIDAGTLINSGTKNITLAGNLSIATNGNYTKGSGNFTFDGSGKTWTDNRAAPADMGAVVIDGGGTISLGSSVKATSVTIGADDVLDVNGTNTLTLTGSGGSVFANSGTFTCSTGTVVYEGTSATTITALNGANKYYNLTVGLSTDTGTFSFTADGEIEASGSLTLIAGSSGVHTFDMSTYNLSVGGGAAGTGGIAVPAETIFTQTSGTTKVSASSGTATLGGAGTTRFYDFQIGNASDGATYTFNLAGDVGASNSFTLAAGTHTLGLSSYEFGLWGDWTMGTDASLSAQTGTINLGNTTSMTLTCSTKCEPYNLTLNKTGTDANDNVTLASNLVVRNTLTITDGQLIQGNNDVRVEGSTAVSIASGVGAEWTNIGTGDLTLGGTFANAGSISFDTSDGGCTNVDDAILIRSTLTGTARVWSGGGTFYMHNLDVQDQSASSIVITAYDSNDRGNNPNWDFKYCTTTGGGASPLRINGNTRIKGGTRIK